MGDFVANDTGDLHFIELREEGVCDEGLAAGQGECVHLLGIDEEAELEIPRMGFNNLRIGPDDAPSYLINECLQASVRMWPAVLLDHLWDRLRVEGNLLLRCKANILVLAGHWIVLALVSERNECEGGPQRGSPVDGLTHDRRGSSRWGHATISMEMVASYKWEG